MKKYRSASLLTVAALALAFAATVARAAPVERTLAFFTDGSVRPVQTAPGAKSLARCNQSPGAILMWREIATPQPRVVISESVGTATQSLQVVLLAKCTPRPSNVTFTYGDRVSGTATQGLDYQAFAAQTTVFTGVTQYFEPERPGTPMAFSAPVIDDTQTEPDESINIDLLALREEFTDAQGGFQDTSSSDALQRYGFTITANDAANQPPAVLMNGTAGTTGTTPVSVALAPLVRDPEGDALTFAIVSTPSNNPGAATIAGSTFTFTPMRGFEGNAVFGLTVSDASNPAVAFTVTVTVTSNSLNRPPAAVNPSVAAPPSNGGAEVSIPLTPLFNDPDGDALVFDVATQAARGTARVVGETAFYVPTANFEGADQFVVRATDPSGLTATVIITIGVSANLDPAETADDLNDALDGIGGGSEVAQAAVTAVANACGEAGAGSGTLATCIAIVDAAEANNGAAVEDALENLAAEEVSAQSNVATAIMSQQRANVAARMAAVRGGATGLSLAGLSIFAGNGALSLGMFGQGLHAAQDDSARGGVGDVRPSPWGVFVNGSIGGGNREGGGTESGFDFDNYGVTAGVDYRLNDRAFVGLALGYSASEVDLDNAAGELDTGGLGLTAYYSWYGDNGWYADGSLGYFRNDYEQLRVIDLSAIGLGTDRALSETDASQFVATFGVGYEFSHNGWLLAPEFRIEYAGTDIDGFDENGTNDSGFLLSFPDQSFQSLQYSGALQVARAISTANGIVQPFLRLDWYYESDNDGFTIIPRLRSNPTQPFAAIVIDDPDRNYGSVSGGLSWVRPGGTQMYLSLYRTFAYDDLEQWVLRGGLRWEF